MTTIAETSIISCLSIYLLKAFTAFDNHYMLKIEPIDDVYCG